MTRGLMKSASIFALGMAMSVTANAADLGGNCCADLEERVAELEATVVKKGNRKVSVQLYGWVNKAIMAWDAPVSTVAVGGIAAASVPTSGVYWGQDNTNSATRFGIRGNAKIDAERSAGYSILLDVASGARTATSTQTAEEASSIAGFSNDHAVRMRDANVWLESSRLGRLTLGRLTGAGPVAVIDLGGIGNIAPGAILSGTGISFANGTILANATDALGDFGLRIDGVKWDSPALSGFTLSASYGETSRKGRTDGTLVGVDGTTYGMSLRYANEFNGVRLAAGIGFERSTDEQPAGPGTGQVATKNFGGSLALLHVATGLFIQGDYLELTRDNTAVVGNGKSDRFIVQAGLKRNFFGIGDTVLYGEYGDFNNAASAFVGNGRISDTNMWGLGMVQNIDAAAMEIYAGYKKFSYKEGALAGPLVGQGDIGLFQVGARINF